MNNRVLGTLAMICSLEPLIDVLLLRGFENVLIGDIGGMVFIAGWICSTIGMWRMRATGTGKWGRGVLLIQLVVLVLAFMNDFFKATGSLVRETIVLPITDAASIVIPQGFFSLSMYWMIVVGIAVIVAKQLPSWQRFVPLLCSFWAPIVIFLHWLANYAVPAELLSAGLVTVLWSLLGYVVARSHEQEPTPTSPESTVR